VLDVDWGCPDWTILVVLIAGLRDRGGRRKQ
jgi:hypothetical protein